MENKQWKRKSSHHRPFQVRKPKPLITSASALRTSEDGGSPWVVEHVDLTCDSCEIEPIVGSRWKCSVCEDRDLCAECFSGLDEARETRSSNIYVFYCLHWKIPKHARVSPVQTERTSTPRKWLLRYHVLSTSLNG
eukprot:8670906-Pyramimonas_sp.AAC.1